MPRINLLPWREELREQRRNQFFVALGGAAGAAALVVFLGVLVMNSVISHQLSRNAVLEEEMKLLDLKIKEIRDLEEQKDSLIARMQIIEQLQQSRPEVVHLFDEMVKTLPEGVYLNKLKQNGKKLGIEGTAESNTRVSAFMRNIDKSEWLTSPDLEIVEVVARNNKKGASSGSRFAVNARQVTKVQPGNGKKVKQAKRGGK